MRGLLGGIVTGGCVSVLALAGTSIVSEQPAGRTPPAPPLVEAPSVDAAPVAADAASNDVPSDTDELSAVGTGTPVADAGASSPVGSVTVQAPQTPDLPNDVSVPEEAAVAVAPSPVEVETMAPAADTAPLGAPSVVTIEGSMAAPAASEEVSVLAAPVEPVLPNPQSNAPQTPASETDLTVSTTPPAPTLVEEPEVVSVVEAPAAEGLATDPSTTNEVAVEAAEEETFVVDPAPAPEERVTEDATEAAPADRAEDTLLATLETPAVGLQLQGEENVLLADRGTGVTVRRLGTDARTDAVAAEPGVAVQALKDFGAQSEVQGDVPLMSFILIDDGSMSAAAAALAGLPFGVTIAVSSDQPDVERLVEAYRSQGFEVMVQADLPEGARPSDVEVAFQDVFARLPESIGLLDMGTAGLQDDGDVTAQAMEALSARGAGFVTVSKGLNMAGRAAEQAGVPAAIVYRDLDADDQDARVIRRFVDQAAFRARQESGVVLVGRVRPDTISALILWGTANSDEQVSIVPLSNLLLAQ